MFDYYSHVYAMTEEQITKEIEKLHNRILKTNPASQVYQQLLNMLYTAQDARVDYYERQRAKNLKDEVIEIGEIQSDVFNPKYEENEILDILVQSYIKPGDKK